MKLLGCKVTNRPLLWFVRVLILTEALILASGCASMYFHEHPVPPEGPPPPIQTLDNLKSRQGWYMIYFKGDEKIGFFHYTISPTEGGNYLIKFDSLQRFKILGVNKEVRIFEEDVVAPDLRFITTSSRLVQDGKEQTVSGSMVGDSLRVEVVTENQKTSKDIPVQQPLYPEAAMDFLPVLKGLAPGREYRYQAFSPMTQSVGEAIQRVVRYERSKLLNNDAYRVETSFQNISITSWFSQKGEKELEMLLGGVFISERQTEAQVKQFILDKTLAKSDLMLDFSRVKTDRPIPSPGNLRSLSVELYGITDERLIIGDAEQRVRLQNDRVLYEIKRSETKEEEAPDMPMAHGPEMKPFLLPSFRIQSHHPDIVRQAREIVGDASNVLTAVQRIAMWVGQEVEDDLVESFSALDVLKTRKGECQAHTFLYTALARAIGIPTRVVSGLVYMEDVGFLFHAWAESFVGRWISVDPTLKQVPSDATHIKLVIGEDHDNFHLIVNVLGRLQASVREFSHWEK